jgi:uncharacterized pyridoxal phosphate-containing UPF0001 family protein
VCSERTALQEAQLKFPDLKRTTPDLELHLIGPLQTNKARDAVALFDVIHTLDRESLAQALVRDATGRGGAPASTFRSTPARKSRSQVWHRATHLPLSSAASREWSLEIHGLMCIPLPKTCPRRTSPCFQALPVQPAFGNSAWA